MKRTPNFNPEILKQIEEKLGLKLEKDFTPEDLFDYIYAVLHSPKYRETYKEFLKIDFPRVPHPKDQDQFWKLSKLGKQIRELHLLQSPLLTKDLPTYKGEGNNEVGKPTFKENCVWINEGQYFEGVSEIAWNFYIGGYQPAQKWLKDRKGRELSFDDVRHYQKIIVALRETERLMGEIDECGFLNS